MQTRHPLLLFGGTTAPLLPRPTLTAGPQVREIEALQHPLHPLHPVHPLQAQVREIEAEMLQQTIPLEAKATELLRNGHTAEARQLLTDFSVYAGRRLLSRWLALWQSLFVQLKDGFETAPRPMATPRDLPGMVLAKEVGYPAEWYARIAADRGGCLSQVILHPLYP